MWFCVLNKSRQVNTPTICVANSNTASSFKYKFDTTALKKAQESKKSVHINEKVAYTQKKTLTN